MTELSDTDKYVFDAKATFYSNIYFILGFIPAVMYVHAFSNMLESFTLVEMKIVGLFVFAYSSIKIVIALTNFNVEYKPR